MIKNNSSPGNNHPQFEGPIMPKKHDKQARASFLDGSGKRQWHTHALAVMGHDAAAIAALVGKIPRTADALAIDPGYAGKGNACACGQDGKLVSVWFEHARDFDSGFAPPLDHVIVEQPQQDGRSWSVPPGTLIKLAFEGALLAGLYAGALGAALHTPTVTEWKGAENKVPMHGRLWSILSLAERVVLGGNKTERAIADASEKGAMCRWSKSGADLYPKTFTTHNLLDAAALLMVAYGRLEKRG